MKTIASYKNIVGSTIKLVEVGNEYQVVRKFDAKPWISFTNKDKWEAYREYNKQVQANIEALLQL